MQTSLKREKTIQLVDGATGAVGNYSANEFIMDCTMGKDIEFAFGGKGYTVLGWWKDGKRIAEWYGEENAKVFKDADDMLDNFKMDGVRLRDAFPEIEVLLH